MDPHLVMYIRSQCQLIVSHQDLSAFGQPPGNVAKSNKLLYDSQKMEHICDSNVLSCLDGVIRELIRNRRSITGFPVPIEFLASLSLLKKNYPLEFHNRSLRYYEEMDSIRLNGDAVLSTMAFSLWVVIVWEDGVIPPEYRSRFNEWSLKQLHRYEQPQIPAYRLVRQRYDRFCSKLVHRFGSNKAVGILLRAINIIYIINCCYIKYDNRTERFWLKRRVRKKLGVSRTAGKGTGLSC